MQTCSPGPSRPTRTPFSHLSPCLSGRQSTDLARILLPYQIALHYTPSRVFRGDVSGAFVLLPMPLSFVLCPVSCVPCPLHHRLRLRLGLQMRRLLLLRFLQLFAQFSFHFGSFFNCSPQMLSIFIFLLCRSASPCHRLWLRLRLLLLLSFRHRGGKMFLQQYFP